MNKECFDKLEDVLGEMESLKRLIDVLLSEFLEYRVEAVEPGELADKYRITQVIINAIFNLLCFQTQETREFIENQTIERE